jgi:hypothetical protein
MAEGASKSVVDVVEAAGLAALEGEAAAPAVPEVVVIGHRDPATT